MTISVEKCYIAAIPKHGDVVTRIEDLNKGVTIHHSLAVYANGNRVEQGVLSTDLEEHIRYNQKSRPGRALFIDGICLNQGYLADYEITSITEELERNPIKLSQVVTPYR